MTLLSMLAIDVTLGTGSIVGLVVLALGGVSTIAALLARGVWDKSGKSAVRDEFGTVWATAAQIETRQKEFEANIQRWWSDPKTVALLSASFRDWSTKPEQVIAQKEVVKEVIENEVRRDDGVIHKDITLKVEALDVDLAKKMDQISSQLVHLQEIQERRDIAMREQSGQILAKLGRMEGALAGVRAFERSGDSAIMPAVRPSDKKP